MELEELKKELEEERTRAKALVSKTERLEEESKKFKSRAQDAEAKISDAEKAKLEEQLRRHKGRVRGRQPQGVGAGVTGGAEDADSDLARHGTVS